MMWWRGVLLALLVATATGKGKKGKHQKPGRALFDRLASTPLSPSLLPASPTASLVASPTSLVAPLIPSLPTPLNVAPFSRIEANATCGQNGVEDFCRQTPGRRGIVCGVCEGPGGAQPRQHPAAHILDGDASTWWQSPTLASGEEFRRVELLVTLPEEMELLHVIIKTGPSSRPLAWSLEVASSEDGDDFYLIRAFGDKEHCRKLWDLTPERRRRKVRSSGGVRRINRADKLTCSTQFSSHKPLENGEMHVAIGEGVSARRVRISLRAGHPSPEDQQFYTVRSLTLAARCLCYGHAEDCVVDKQGATCTCLHNTCGVHCERCCDGSKWSPNEICNVSSPERRCRCEDRGECVFDDTGAAVCVNCTENRTGPMCDKCRRGFYSEVPNGPCLPCACHPEGSDGACKFNRKKSRVSCSCYPGVAGPKCDTCLDSAAEFPSCDVMAPSTHRCKCDPRGIRNPEMACDDVCDCKMNVIGERCDTCAPGHFGLNANWPEGCKPCYCSGVTEECVQDTSVGEPLDLPMGEDKWLVTDLDGQESISPSVDEEGNPYVISYEVEGWETFYLSTAAFEGDQLNRYGGDLRISMYWGVVRGDAGGSPTRGPDVLIVGEDGIKLAYGDVTHESPGEMEIIVPMVEGNWYILSTDRHQELASRSQFMDVLSNARALMIRAHFHSDQDEVRLVRSRFLAPPPGSRELCACPHVRGRAGAHCTRCADTHVRAAGGDCVPCPCNLHATCTHEEGPCGECKHNTTGPHCERCLPGHYGNPVEGGCIPCACPLFSAHNNFSPVCARAAPHGDGYVCTRCALGHAGDHCESCEVGYWGSPTTEGSSCQPCDCGGAPCDPITGACQTCPPHAEGATCDLCQEGYYISLDGSCSPCACGPGALAAACEARGGQCACAAQWAGRACDTCRQGHGDVSAGCPPCRCGVGATQPECDAVTGACKCAVGVTGLHCDECKPQYYGLTSEGCKGCNCSSLGSESNVCDIKSGQCRCKPHVIGRACDVCEEGYWGLSEGGCRRCACAGGSSSCDPVTGECACGRGVTGAHCDKCAHGFYGFGPNGCLPCPVCPSPWVCSPWGRCACPSGSRGPQCSECARGYWGRAPHCQPCRCGPGATTGTCDPVSGQCACRTGWSGRACASCAPGHYGARCRACACDPRGALCPEGGVCPCDEDGRCVCKENVIGDKCTECRNGTFGLSADTPSGCTGCFCFGRAAHCTQAGLTRGALRDHRPTTLTIIRDGVIAEDQTSLLIIPANVTEATITIPYPPAPVYKELDKRFLGDKVTSYGGFLRFTLEEEGGEELSPEVKAKFPLVRIFGRDDLVLDYYERVPPSPGHAVRLHESLWRLAPGHAGQPGHVGQSGQPGPTGHLGHVSRAALMVALQRLRAVLVRVAVAPPAMGERSYARLVGVSLDTTAPGGSRSAPALGVELCACPGGYAAPSCQAPAPGFYMPRETLSVRNVAGTILIDLDGDVLPCDCNGRANTCDPVTGYCLNCTHGTGGPQCESCAEGYYGAPDTPGGCQACPCPERTRNFAAACAFTGHQLRCLCKPGYTGSECEDCDQGWTRSPDGSCEPCACDPIGSLDHVCDRRGKCRCKHFATGKKCDQCVQSLSFMDEDGCRTCDNCTLTLIDSVQSLTRNLHNRAAINTLSKIPKPFLALNQYTDKTRKFRSNLTRVREYAEQSRKLTNNVQALEDEANSLDEVATIKLKEAQMGDQASYLLSLESSAALEEVLKQRRKMAEEIAMLDEFARGERHLSAHKALKEAKHLLRNIKGIRVIDYLAGANDAFDLAILQSAAIQEYNYRINDTLDRLSKLKKSMETWETKADDIPKLTDIVWDAGDTVAALTKRTKPRLVEIRDQGLRCALVLEDINTLNPRNLTLQAQDAIYRAMVLSKELPALTSTLVTLTSAAEEKEGILYNLTPKYREKYLNAVQEHATELSEKARRYKNLFAGTKTTASAGMSAARAWTEVTDTLRDAAIAAEDAVTKALIASKLARGAKPMMAMADNVMKVSREQAREGEDVKKRAEELRIELEHLRRGAERVGVALRGLGWQERELAARPKAEVSETLAAASEKSDRVFGTTRVLYDEASEIRRRVRYQMRRQLGELQKLGDSALGATQEHISQILGDVSRGKQLASALSGAAHSRAAEHEAADATLRPRLDSLAATVARARHAADSISVSLTSPIGPIGCSRSYPLPPSSPSTTHISVTVSFDNEVKDGPIFHLEGEQGYMDLRVEDARLKLVWDLGDGDAVIDHPEELEATHDDSDQTSYKIDVERVWNTAHLVVEKAGRTAVSASNMTLDSKVSLSATSLWLGSGQAENGLVGCIHALTYDDRRIGLWNFVKRAGQCKGCTQRWYNPSRGGEPSLAWFNGEGYAELRRSGFRPFDRRQLSVSFSFKTRDQDALLFMAKEKGSNRSVSLTMESCRVIFRVEYTSSSLQIAAGGRHCHGRLVHVQASRLFANGKLERGSLRVNSEERQGSPEPPVQSPLSLPDLANASYWLGGAPPGVFSTPPALLGCLGALIVDREGYDPLDTPNRHGVEHGCGTRTLRSVKLKGQGFVELPSPAYRRKAAIGLTFRSSTAGGTLLYRAPSSQTIDNELEDEETQQDDKHYLALLLNEGDLELFISAGKGELHLRTNGTDFNDGMPHTVRLMRIHKELELWVDERRLAGGKLGGNALPSRSRGLFIGGVSEGVTLGGRALKGFHGTIADFIVDGLLVGVETALRWENCELGRADIQPVVSAHQPTQLVAPPPELNMCTKAASYTVEPGAVKFGDSPYSHSLLRLPPGSAKELALSLQLRTFAKDGILALIPGSKMKPKHYAAVLVREGKLRLIVRGRKRRELTLASVVNDGTWRSISIRISSSRLVLASGGAAATAKAPKKVGLSARLYIGGVPDRATMPNLPDAVWSVGAVGGVVGCVRRCVVSGRARDVARGAAGGAGQCAPNVERAAHYSGDAYAIWSSTWSPGAGSGEGGWQLRVQFRTTAPSGVLLAARSFVLETSGGAVILTRYSLSGEATSRAETRGDAERSLCDDKWHLVAVRLSPSVAAVSIDGGIEARGNVAGLIDETTDAPVTTSPLYIGGLPDGMSDYAGAGKENFKGCIRDVTVGGEKREWKQMEQIHNVRLDSCPIPQ